MFDKTLEEFFFEELTSTNKYLPLHGVFGFRDRMALDKKTFIKGNLAFIIIDKEFNIVYRNEPAYTKGGEYHKASERASKKFGLQRILTHTESTMDELLKNVFNTIYLSYICKFNPRLTIEEKAERESKCSPEFIEFKNVCSAHRYLTTQAEIELERSKGILDISYVNASRLDNDLKNVNNFLSKNRSVTPIQDAFAAWYKSKGLDYTHVVCGNQLPFMKTLVTEMSDEDNKISPEGEAMLKQLLKDLKI